jgi:prephenate dehydratase
MADEPAYRADVAYQGTPGAFSEDAAWAMAGTAARLLPCRTLDDVRTALECGRAASAVIPVWNSIAGEVPGAAPLLEHPRWRPVGSHTLPIIQCLVAASGTSLHQIRDVRSHPIALAQCRRFFAGHDWLRPVPDFDTAGCAALIAASGARQQAAVAGARAACVWGLHVVAGGIQDTPDNRTVFVHVMPEKGGDCLSGDPETLLRLFAGRDAHPQR